MLNDRAGGAQVMEGARASTATVLYSPSFLASAPVGLTHIALHHSGANGHFNSLAPGGFYYSLKLVNFKLISMINILSIFCEIAIRWMPQHLSDH